MAPSPCSSPLTTSLATVLVLDALRPVREALRQVFADLDDGEALRLEQQVRWCGSAPVYVGSPQEARHHAARLAGLGLTTSVNQRLA
ncbi:MAG: hypothetical protein VKO39_00030 [Cyanobacteriota bacterium]|nr:hypothetical protein [Cyanobacteriota bacterium]